ncbi:MAG: trypsin-like peptidase domain-containing protein [Actinobacteria bacterium]|nr:trypsin-like peptidase domain-containing protein [Actinomycetota bacterium]MBU1943224.1 trypsin-like peptidase domain-containing protein [Actinomycetota bacterium]MBU2686217.1 trypsin-like peptidase domain-containing protein [Actinomycetota bacterium]
MEWDQGSTMPPGRGPAAPVQGYYGQYGHGAQAPGAPSRPARRRNAPGLWKTALTAVVAAVMGALLVLLLLPVAFGVSPLDLMRGRLRNAGSTVTSIKSAGGSRAASPTQGATDVATVAEKVTPSVVNIDVRISGQPNPFFQSNEQEGTGSGVIYSSDGYIITNNHVVEDAREITVTPAGGEELTGKVLGTDPENDIAVVKVDKAGLPAITPGDSDDVVVGELVVAVGSPLGFEKTVTAGIVSALQRNVPATNETTGQSTVLTDLIQTDASINPGNSGGALCDSSGALIGINTIIASQSGGSEGIGFAIPVNTVKQVADDLIAGRPVSHPYVGVLGQTLTEGSAGTSALPVEQGVYVTQVLTGSPAAKAGMRDGDVIVEAGGQAVETMNDLVAAVRKAGVGGKLEVTWYRGGDRKAATLTVEEKPSSS